MQSRKERDARCHRKQKHEEGYRSCGTIACFRRSMDAAEYDTEDRCEEPQQLHWKVGLFAEHSSCRLAQETNDPLLLIEPEGGRSAQLANSIGNTLVSMSPRSAKLRPCRGNLADTFVQLFCRLSFAFMR